MEGTDGVGKATLKETEDIQPDQDGKYPETVPWSKYVGIKQSLGTKLDAAKDQVKNLEEQLSKAIKQEDFEGVKGQLAQAKTDLESTKTELQSIKEKSLGDKVTYLKSKGVSDEDLTDASEVTLNAMIKVLDTYKPKPDFSGAGGGTGVPQGHPRELARQAYSQKA